MPHDPPSVSHRRQVLGQMVAAAAPITEPDTARSERYRAHKLTMG
jgi:hypothetical protein